MSEVYSRLTIPHRRFSAGSLMTRLSLPSIQRRALQAADACVCSGRKRISNKRMDNRIDSDQAARPDSGVVKRTYIIAKCRICQPSAPLTLRSLDPSQS